MDTAQWPHQGIGLMKRPLEQLMVSSAAGGAATSSVSNSGGAPTSTALRAAPPQQVPEKKARPPRDQALNCPRCNSTNTKFCYYNNYSMTQPRYFCKTCRRYWTEGGSLRNVPVGGGSRKNKRPSSSSSSSAAARNTIASAGISSITNNAPKLFHHGQDLNLAAFPDQQPAAAAMSAMDFLRGGMSAAPYMVTGGENLFSPAGGYGHMDFRQQTPAAAATATALQFPLDTAGSGGPMHGFTDPGSSGRLLFPFEDLRQVPSVAGAGAGDEFDQKPGGGGEASGFWTGMIGGNGGSW